MSGDIVVMNSNVGMHVAPSDTMLEIGHLHLELNVFEKDILKVKVEQDINFTVPEATNEIFHAKVHLVGNQLKNERTINVHGHFRRKFEAKTNYWNVCRSCYCCRFKKV
jgi:cobalt-zinc-cadmium efflux system membrane fusion protein